MCPNVDRADLRRMVNSEAPQWVKDMAQSMLDWGNELSRSHHAAFVPRALPLLPPQLPPGNGQPNDPCSCCGGAGGHAPWCFADIQRHYGDAFTLSMIDWPIWTGPAERRTSHPRRGFGIDLITLDEPYADTEVTSGD